MSDAGVSVEMTDDELIKKKVREMVMTKKTPAVISNLIAFYITNKSKIKTISNGKNFKMYIYCDGIYRDNAVDMIKKESQKILREHCKNGLVNEIIGSIERQTLADKEELELQNKNIICIIFWFMYNR